MLARENLCGIQSQRRLQYFIARKCGLYLAITKIPETGWADAVGAVPSYGYVAQYNGIYCRLYVTEYMLDSEGNRIGAILKYQAPFVPEK